MVIVILIFSLLLTDNIFYNYSQSVVHGSLVVPDILSEVQNYIHSSKCTMKSFSDYIYVL